MRVKQENNKELKRKILLLSTLVVLLVSSGFSQPLSKTSFQIGEYNSARKSLQFVSRKKIPDRSGLSVSLVFDRNKTEMYLSPMSDSVKFGDFATKLKNHLDNNPNLIFPLFINHSGPENWVIKALNKSGLRNRVFHLPSGEQWPNIEEIKKQDRRLVIFTYYNNNSGSKAYQYAWDHIAQFPFTSFLLPVFEGYYSNGAIENELMMLKDFMHLNESLDGLPPTWDRLNLNTFMLDHTLKCWKITGKRPNFIFYSRPSTEDIISWLIPMLNNYTNISGIVTFDGKPLKKVSWVHDNEFVTNGNFNFPITEGYELELTPTALGFTFSPSSVTITDEMSDPGNAHFLAKPLKLEDELTGYFNFNGKLENAFKPSDNFKLNGSEFAKDVIRGDVLKIQDSAFVAINPATDLGIVNNSFTMSIWFKLIEAKQAADYCIIGTDENEYRKGLHINIRKQVPYFGFYNNDVTSYLKVEALKWYHMAIRYNIENGEQSIYINGQKTGSSNNHPSFIGESELLLGHGIGMNNFFDGYIDDFCIWKRALSDDEILKLMTTEIDVKRQLNPTYVFFIIILVAIGVLLFGVLLYLRIRKQNSKRLRIVDEKPTLNISKNSILLFGDFSVIDKEGHEIASTFSPKIKEVFMLIFLSTVKHGRGISTKQLTETIWSGFSTTKAANNRGVTLNKLKKLLVNVDGIQVVFEDGYWKTTITKNLVCDYTSTLDTIKMLDTRNPENYPDLYNIVSRGAFLENINWDWLDEFRSAIIFEISDALLVYCKLLLNAKEFEQLYKVANRILKIDDLNEQATVYQLNYLCYKGHHNKSKHKFQQFCERYTDVYGQTYQYDFQQFLKLNPDQMN